jgi:hypothetical protein
MIGYVGIAIIILGALVWIFRPQQAGDVEFEFLGFKAKVNAPAIAVMALGIVMALVGRDAQPVVSPSDDSKTALATALAEKATAEQLVSSLRAQLTETQADLQAMKDGASKTSAAWRTSSFPYKNESSAVPRDIANFVNEHCAPSDPSGITGVVIMNADLTYDTHVWCRADHSNKKWRPETRDTTAGWEQALADSLSLGVQSLIGIVRGSGGNTIFVLRND